MRTTRSRRIRSARQSHNEFVVLLVTRIATNSLPPFAETAETDPKQRDIREECGVRVRHDAEMHSKTIAHGIALLRVGAVEREAESQRQLVLLPCDLAR